MSPYYIEEIQKIDREKEETFSFITGKVKFQFCQISVSFWLEKLIPVVETSTYDVSPGTVHDQWLDMYKTVSAISAGSRWKCSFTAFIFYIYP